MRKKRNVWVVVADGAKARFLTPNEDVSALLPAGPGTLRSQDAKLHSRDLKSDRPGRSISSSRSGVRHAIEPKHDHHKMEKHRFTAAVTDLLDEALGRKSFDQLVIVAPRRTLGEMRNLLPDQVKARVQQEIAKDLTRRSDDELWTTLAPIVVPLAVKRPIRAS